ncbi:MAG: glycosyltransferase family 9 protein [Planctomycetota bacterium]|nr:MAG: glycosyltransferase family 9 protein [Planctomycetota bacterium]
MSAVRSAAGGHLVVRAPNWVGDLVMSTPVLAAALECEHWSRTTLLVRSHLAPVLADAPFLARRAPETDGTVATTGSSAEERALLARLAPDAVLLLGNSFGAAWRAWRARVPIRAGAALSGRRFLLTHSVVPPTIAGRRAPIPSAHLMRDVAGLLGILPPDLHPRLGLAREAQAGIARDLAERGLEPGEPYVIACPGAAFGAAKLWPPAHFARALDGLHGRFGWRAVVAGGPGEGPLIAAVVESCEHDALELTGGESDLARLKALVRGARLMLVGDSGPRWFAAAFDVPCVSVMGPNFPELTASSLELCEVVRRTDLECAPCLRRVCPLGHHRCMTELQPELVVAAAARVLERAARSAAPVVEARP